MAAAANATWLTKNPIVITERIRGIRGTMESRSPATLSITRAWYSIRGFTQPHDRTHTRHVCPSEARWRIERACFEACISVGSSSISDPQTAFDAGALGAHFMPPDVSPSDAPFKRYARLKCGRAHPVRGSVKSRPVAP